MNINVVSSSTEQEVEISTPNVQKLSSDLRPLMFWMSNATELLNFFQVKVEAMEKEWEFEGEGKLRTPREALIIVDTSTEAQQSFNYDTLSSEISQFID